MYNYSKTSKRRLSTCHKDLQKVFNFVIKYIDCSIVCGHRGQIEQDDAFDGGFSKLIYPFSKHNKLPSMAVDCIPYPTKWTDMDAMQVLGGFIMGVASMMYEKGEITHLIRWGHDWDMDNDYGDQTFIDAPHYELYKP